MDDVQQQQDALQEEQFSQTLTDEQLLAQIEAWNTEGVSFQGELRPIWEQNLAYYNGFQTDVEKILSQKESKAVENRVWMAVETMIPIATGRLPDTIVKPGAEDEQARIDAMELQDVLNYQFENVRIQSLAERFLRDMVLKRYGVFKIFWNTLTDDVGLRLVDPKRLKFPKFGENVHALKFIIEELELSYDSLVEHFGKEKADKIKSDGEKSNGNVRQATYTVQEVWTNKYVVWKSGNYICKKQDNPYYAKTKKANFFDEPKKPYVIKSLFETTESIIGSTDYVQQTIRIQDNVNIRKRQIENTASKTANPDLMIDSQVMSREEAESITNEPGQILYGKDAANPAKIRYQDPGQLPQYVFQDLEASRREFDNIWGLHSTTRGEREGRETLGGRQILREADLGRIDLCGRQLERALDEVAEWWTQLIRLNYTEERAFTLMGPEGVKFVKGFVGSKVSPKVRPQVKSGSTLKEDEASIKQLGLLLWQNKAIGLKTLYRMLRLPSIEQAQQEFQETWGQPAPEGGQPPVMQ